ncbi:MAG: hypothetical protein ACKOXB_08770 [Flavobacteriales bacterium]
MKKLIALLLFSQCAFAQQIVNFDPSTFSFRFKGKLLKTGPCEGKDAKGKTRLKFFLDDSKKVKRDFSADLIYCADEEIIDSSGALPSGKAELYFPNGKLNAKGPLFPAFKRRLTVLKETIVADTMYDYDDEGNAIPMVIVTPQRQYSSTPDEYILIPYGEWTYYDSEGNITAKKYFADLELTKMYYRGLDYRDFYYAHPDLRTRAWEINYDSTEHTKIRQEKYFQRNLQMEEVKIYCNEVLIFHRKPNDYNCFKESWFSPDGKICTQEVSYVNNTAQGFYFKTTEKGDTLESGFFNKGLQQGPWKKYDSLNNISFTGLFNNGRPISQHYYQNGVRQKSTHYIQYLAKDSLPHLRFIKYDTISDNGIIHSYKDSLVWSVLNDSLYFNGKLKQVIEYDPYHYWDYYTSHHYYRKFGPNMLDGVYIPERPSKIHLPDFTYNPLQSLDDPAVFHKINFNSKEIPESELIFRKGKPFDGYDISYFDDGALQYYACYEKGVLKNSVTYNNKGEITACSTNNGKRSFIKNENDERTYYNGILMGPFTRPSYKGRGFTKGTYLWSWENGWQKNFDEKGHLLYEGNMHFSVKDGQWSYYDTLGKIIRKEEYVLGDLLGPIHKESPRTLGLLQIYEGNSVRSHYASAVFGHTVPDGKIFHSSDSAVYINYCQDCWEDSIPGASTFQSIDQHSFVMKCQYFEPLKYGEEKIKEGNSIVTLFNHRAKLDSTYYFWSSDEKDAVRIAYKIKLNSDFRFVKTDSLSGEKTLYFEEPNGVYYGNKKYYSPYGKISVYYPNGSPKTEYFENDIFASQEKEGVRSWYPSGQLKFEGKFLGTRSSNIAIGKHVLYYENGAIQEVRNFNDTALTVDVFNKNGIRISSGNYSNQEVYYNYLYQTDYYEIPVSAAYPKDGWQAYYDQNGKEIKREYYEMNKPKKESHLRLRLGKWVALPLEGCDATSFYIDESKNYWLGTGSSGGVYFSTDKGKTWTAKNKGIGPVHVERIGEYKGKIFIVVPDILEEESSKIYEWGKNKWTPIANDESFPDIIKNLDNATKEKSAKIPFAIDTLKAEYNMFYWDHANRFMEKYTGSTSYAEALKYKDSSLVLPYALVQPGGNYVPESDSTGVFYGKTGLYYWQKDSLFSKATKGLNATDIREVIRDKKQNIWAVAGLGDIWKYSKNQWVLVFDFIAHKKSEKLQTTSGLTMMGDDIFFCSWGKVWKIKASNEVELFSGKNWPVSTVMSFSGKSENDFFILGPQANDTEDESNGSYAIFHFENQNFTKVILKGGIAYWKSMLKTSPTGESWFFDGEKIVNLSVSTIPVFEEKSALLPGHNLISFNNKGEMIYALRGDMLLHYSKEKGAEIQRTEELRGLVSIALSDDGKIYAGTGFDYLPACGVITIGQAHGMFLLNENNLWTEIKNNINPWIMCLNFLDQQTLLVGTSGTGLYLYHLKK